MSKTFTTECTHSSVSKVFTTGGSSGQSFPMCVLRAVDSMGMKHNTVRASDGRWSHADRTRVEKPLGLQGNV